MLMSPEGGLNLDRKAGLLQITDYLDRLDKIANDLDVVESRILPLQVLEQLRILSNLETDKAKLLQMILVGQQNLKSLLRAPELRQLDQRVSIRYELKPLTEHETTAYIYHRLYVAGGATTVSFTPKALRAVFQSSGGIPRLINLICDRSLLGAFSTKANKVAHDLVIRATKSLDLRQVEKPRFSWLRRRRPFVAGFGTSAVSGA